MREFTDFVLIIRFYWSLSYITRYQHYRYIDHTIVVCFTFNSSVIVKFEENEKKSSKNRSKSLYSEIVARVMVWN